MRRVTIVLLVGLAALPLTAQTPSAEDARFEVVSVRPLPAGSPGGWYRPTPEQFTATMSVVELAQFAYQRPFWGVVDGPGWARDERFDITAAMPANRVTGDLPFMVRHLLADRFALIVHREQRPLPVFALVRTRSDGELGPRLRSVAHDCATANQPGGERCTAGEGIGRYTTQGYQWENIVRALERRTGRPILDETGLSGQWDLDLEWNPQISRIPEGFNSPPLAELEERPVLFTAIQEQLGLKLEPREAPVEVIVIDSAERPEPN